MRNLLLGGISILLSFYVLPAFGAYQPSPMDEQLIEVFSAKITDMYENDPGRVVSIESKLRGVLRQFETDTRVYYVLGSLREHMLSVLRPLMVIEEPNVVLEEPNVVLEETSMPIGFSAPVGGPAGAVQLHELVEGAYIKGNADAAFVLIEFSDFQCPFCQQFSLSHTIDEVVDHFDGQVNAVFAHYPLESIHPLAQYGAHATECVGAQGGAEAFYEYKEELFFLGLVDEEIGIRALDMIDASVDESIWQSCMDAQEYAEKIQGQKRTGAERGVAGTPSLIFFNRVTGDFKVFRGSASAQSLILEIKQLEPAL